eukprot:CAMPEP_0173134162 /NCGR_PEP_ID=MMETSP1105-20130129/1134_1 /TAXON_ID=2985 /ORGANISM="Ochromonas sp., Strain BG-1" /LENGTH=63 /DNA_ID=CAMNT_0014045921 /DNA_START=130 /DNA_END=321 /DNA_ORIENTATION=+
MTNIKQIVSSSKPAVTGILLAASVVTSFKILINDKTSGNLIAKHYKTSPPIHHEEIHSHMFRS